MYTRFRCSLVINVSSDYAYSTQPGIRQRELQKLLCRSRVRRAHRERLTALIIATLLARNAVSIPTLAQALQAKLLLVMWANRCGHSTVHLFGTCVRTMHGERIDSGLGVDRQLDVAS